MKKIFLVITFTVIFAGVFAAPVSLVEAANSLKAELLWEPLSASAVLLKNGNQLHFKVDESIMLINYKKMEIIDPPKMVDGTVFISQDFFKRAENLLMPTIPGGTYKIGAILIDPGHGGRDVGAVGNITVSDKKTKIYEKDINLKVSEILFHGLKNVYPNKQIRMTRNSDIFLTLEQRVEIANAIPLESDEAILYVSIHTNSAFDKKASGFEVWYLSPGYRRNVLDSDGVDENLHPILNSMLEEEFTKESILIAKFILDGMDAEIGKKSVNRGVKAEEWFVVRNANMPSVLVEMGFISNPDEAVLLNDEKYLQELSKGIQNGLHSFITFFERAAQRNL
ncbi:MAG: N-acetylmuramoyl-L-alanine amidase [Treponemataceae bacterium]